jgi:hypothetical protein
LRPDVGSSSSSLQRAQLLEERSLDGMSASIVEENAVRKSPNFDVI